MKRRQRRKHLIGLAVAGFFLMPGLASAQASFVLPPVDGAADSAATPATTLLSVVLRGNTVVSSETLQTVAAPYLNRPASGNDLEDLRQKLIRAYTDRGYVSSGVVWQGGIANGVLTGNVIEGRLSAIRLNGMQGLDERYLTRRLSTTTDGPFNLDVLRERFQVALGDPLIARMNARVSPGEQAGEAILDVDVVLAPTRQFTLFANNYRPPSIGANAVGIGASFRNLTGFGDVLEASLQHAPQSGAKGRASLSWNTPVGFAGTRFTLALDHGDSSVVEQPSAALDISGQLGSVDVGLSQMLAESLTQKFSLGINHVKRDSRTLLMGSPFSFTPNEPEGVTREALWRVWQDFSYRTPTQVVALRSTFTLGRNNLVDVPGLPPQGSPAQSFKSWMGQAQWARQMLDNGAQLVVRGTLQRTPDRLLPLDGLAVGGVNTVRGFRENQLVRDNGAYLNVEFDYPVLQNAASGTQLNLVPFVDYGWARNTGGPTATLASAGLAARVQWHKFNMDLVVAKRLKQADAPASGSSNLQDKGVHVQVAYRF